MTEFQNQVELTPRQRQDWAQADLTFPLPLQGTEILEEQWTGEKRKVGLSHTCPDITPNMASQIILFIPPRMKYWINNEMMAQGEHLTRRAHAAIFKGRNTGLLNLADVLNPDSQSWGCEKFCPSTYHQRFITASTLSASAWLGFLSAWVPGALTRREVTAMRSFHTATREAPPLSTTRENPCTAQHNQK